MKIHNNISLRAGGAYFLILLVIALWVRDIPNQPSSFTTTIEQVIATSPMGDPKSFGTAAIEVAEKGWITTANDWVFNLWPPGFVLMEALILKIFGLNAPIILILQILSAALFSGVLTLLFSSLSENMPRRRAFIPPLVIFVFPVSRVFLLEPTGLTLGENFAIGFFLVFMLLTLRAVNRNSFFLAVGAGLFLGLSAYFRSQFEIILWGFTGWAFLILSVVGILKLTKFRDIIKGKDAKKAALIMVTVLIVAHAATLPWRYYHLKFQQSPKWVHTSSVTFGNAVQTTEYLVGAGGGFVVAGGGNLVCRIDPTTCGDLENAQQLFIKTFLENPIEWYSLKLEVIGEYWFSSVENWSTTGNDRSWLDVLINCLLLIVLLGILFLLFCRKVMVHKAWLLLFWFSASLFSTYFLIFTVQQFEVRYFYFPKIMGLIMLLILTNLYWVQQKKLS